MNGLLCGHPEDCSAQTPLLLKGEREQNVGEVTGSGPLRLVAFPQLSFHVMQPVLSDVWERFPSTDTHQQRMR